MMKKSVRELASTLPDELFGENLQVKLDFVKVVFDLVSAELASGRKVSIKGLGDFIPTGSETDPVAFEPDKAFADAVNAPFASFSPEVLEPGVTEEMLSEFDASEIVAEEVLVPSQVIEPLVEESIQEEADTSEEVTEESVENVEEVEREEIQSNSREDQTVGAEALVDEIKVPETFAAPPEKSVEEEDATDEIKSVPELSPTFNEEDDSFGTEPETITEVDIEDEPGEIDDSGESVDTEASEGSRFSLGFVVGLITGLAVGAIAFLIYVLLYVNNSTKVVEEDEIEEFEPLLQTPASSDSLSIF